MRSNKCEHLTTQQLRLVLLVLFTKWLFLWRPIDAALMEGIAQQLAFTPLYPAASSLIHGFPKHFHINFDVAETN